MGNNSIILCERCVKSDHCMVLKPCKDFAPEQSSNFLAEVKMQKRRTEMITQRAYNIKRSLEFIY